MTFGRNQVDRLVGRLHASVGEPVFLGVTAPEFAPEPRESWIDLQDEVTALAAHADPAARADLARALLHAILQQTVLGGGNPISLSAFDFIRDAVPDELASGLEPAASRALGHGSQGYLHQHVFALPGPEGARWLGTLARAADWQAACLLRDMTVGELPPWSDEDWPDRLDAMAELPRQPRPEIVAAMAVVRPPRVAWPAFLRLALAHGVDERDPLVLQCARCLRDERASAADRVDLVDWEARHRRAELFRWLLELSGDAGERSQFVEAALRAGELSEYDGRWLSEPLERPAWIDGEVPWEVVSTAVAGELRLPDGQLTGADPWWAFQGFPWTIPVPPGSYPVHVIVASHPLQRDECAALELLLADDAPETWEHVPGSGALHDGYHVEVGVASFGAPAAWDSVGDYFEGAGETFFNRSGPAWATADGGDGGTIVYCSVGPQHQLCRTWLGTRAGRPVAVVTDLGLLGLDLAEDPKRPWR